MSAEVKTFEIRDRATCVPMFAVRFNMSPLDFGQYALLRRVGFGTPPVFLHKLNDGRGTSDMYEWGDRTFLTAHNYITDNWNTLQDGQVICVEYILGERPQPAESDVHG